MHVRRWTLLLVGWIWLTLSLSVAAAEGDAGPALSEKDREALGQLAEAIDQPAQRKALVGELRQIADDDEDAASGDADAQPDMIALEAVSENTRAAISHVAALPKRLATRSRSVALEVGTAIQSTWTATIDAFSGHDRRLRQLDGSALLAVLGHIALLVIATQTLYHGLRLATRSLKRRVERWSLAGQFAWPLLRKVLVILLVAGSDILFIVMTYLCINAVELYVIGGPDSFSTQVALFLNAFVVVEAVKIGARIPFYPRYPGLRLLIAPDAVARVWYGWLATLINLIGYGYLVAVPLIDSQISPALALTASTLIAFAAFIYGVWGVWSRRRPVRQGLREMVKSTDLPITRAFLYLLARTWHLFALAYFVMLMVVTLLRAGDGLPFVLAGTLKTLLIVGGALLLSSFLTHSIGHHIRLPQRWNQSVPGIEQRLNTYVPLLLRVVRFVLLILAIMGLLAAWELIDLHALAQSSAGQAFIDKWLGVFIIIAVTGLIWLVISSLIEHRLYLATDRGRNGARARTLLSLFRNATAIALSAIATMMVLAQLGMNIGPLIAGAGVFGLAVGFGAQTLVKDVITGIFIQIENAMNTGDVVKLGDIAGKVERISIRSVALRDVSGTYHVIPFSSVTTVSNLTRGYSCHTADYSISYREDVDEACAQLQAAFDELVKDDLGHSIIEPITIGGVSELGENAVNIFVSIKTMPGDQWTVGRAYNRLVKRYFDRAGIEIPYPHQTVYFGVDKSGAAPPMAVRMLEPDTEPAAQPARQVPAEATCSATPDTPECRHQQDQTRSRP